MLQLVRVRQWFIGALVICLLWAFSQPLLAQNSIAQNTPLTLAPQFQQFTKVPFSQYPAITCTKELLYQYNQQAKVPLNCQVGSQVPTSKLLSIGMLSNFGLNQTSLQSIAQMNGINLNNVNVTKLGEYYSLITPNALVGKDMGGLFKNASLGSLPLVQAAFIQKLSDQVKIGNLSGLSQLNISPGDFGNISGLSQKLSQLPLSTALANIPSFGNYSLGNVPINIAQQFSVANAIPNLPTQTPIGIISGAANLTVDKLAAIGGTNLSLSQLPIPLQFAAGAGLARFDLPLGDDEKNIARTISGGNTGKFKAESCSKDCTHAEIFVSGRSPLNGAAWVDGKNWVPDGFGPLCTPWSCKGPTGNEATFNRQMRFLLTNINPSRGTGQVSFTFPMCLYYPFTSEPWTCTPAVFPIPSGIPIFPFSVSEASSGLGIPFVVPSNFRYANSPNLNPQAQVPTLPIVSTHTPNHSA
jgi:hypothetical protein